MNTFCDAIVAFFTFSKGPGTMTPDGFTNLALPFVFLAFAILGSGVTRRDPCPRHGWDMAGSFLGSRRQ